MSEIGEYYQQIIPGYAIVYFQNTYWQFPVNVRIN